MIISLANYPYGEIDISSNYYVSKLKKIINDEYIADNITSPDDLIISRSGKVLDDDDYIDSRAIHIKIVNSEKSFCKRRYISGR